METTKTIAESCVDKFASDIEAALKRKNTDYSDINLAQL